jgi:hypothetical protein
MNMVLYYRSVMKSLLLFLTAFFTSNFKERRDLALPELRLTRNLKFIIKQWEAWFRGRK